MSSALVQYEAARRALAQARRIDEVMAIRDMSERMKLYARQADDREMMADAAEIKLRAEQRLGTLIIEAKEAGQIVEGRRRKEEKNCQERGQFPRVTLEEVGISRNLSSVAQKRASISEQALENVIRANRDRIMARGAKLIDAPRPGEGSRVQAPGDLDYSPTWPWATRALLEHVFKHLGRLGHCKFQKVWEPACGEGHMAEVLGEYFRSVLATDIHNHGYSPILIDFLSPPERRIAVDWIITNPPFEDRVLKFILQALRLTGTGVAMFVQLRYLEGVERYQKLFSIAPPTIIAPFAERVPLVMGRLDPEASTTTAFVWLVWVKGMAPQAPFWIPPGCSKSLSKPDDIARFTQQPVQKREVKAEAS